MTVELARDRPETLYADTLGAAWLAVAGRILADGIASSYDGLAVREVSLVTLAVEAPKSRVGIIDSRNGSASAVPNPRKTIRLDKVVLIFMFRLRVVCRVVFERRRCEQSP